jgi:hypothetical protein
MSPNPVLTLLLPIISGGLAGGLVSVISNRIFHWRALRTKFYPVLNNMYCAYVIRMEKPEGRYWVNIVGQNPSPADQEFIDHRSGFIQALIEFNELKEARVLRTAILDNSMREHKTPGILSKLDLQPEATALDECMRVLHKKLKL